MKMTAESVSFEEYVNKTVKSLRATFEWRSETTGWDQGIGEATHYLHELIESSNCRLLTLKSLISMLRSRNIVVPSFNVAAPPFADCLEKSCRRICREMESEMPKLEKRLRKVNELARALNWLSDDWAHWNEELDDIITFVNKKMREHGSTESRRIAKGWRVFSRTPNHRPRSP